MSKFFSIKDIESQQPAQEDKGDIKIQKFQQLHQYKVKHLKDLMGGFPAAGEIFFLWTVNSFNAFTFIPYLINHAGSISELIISTYSINN